MQGKIGHWGLLVTASPVMVSASWVEVGALFQVFYPIVTPSAIWRQGPVVKET